MTDNPILAFDWRWHDFGHGLILVTEGGGSRVVLGGKVGSRTGLMPQVRDAATGFMRPMSPRDDVARVIAAAPRLLRALKASLHALKMDADHRSEIEDIEALIAELDGTAP